MPLLFSFKLLLIHFSNLDNPCELLSAFVLGNGCPCALLFSGIPCTCPFNPLSINLPPTVFEIRRVNEYFIYFFTVSFYSVFLVQQLNYVLTPMFILQNQMILVATCYISGHDRPNNICFRPSPYIVCHASPVNN